jgi:uncharacterized protein
MRSVDLLGIQMESTTGTLVVLLRERDEPGRVLPLFVGTAEGTAIALGASDQAVPRPMTHDLMADLVEQLGAHLTRVEVGTHDDATFSADLVLSGPTGALRVDARPSDAIALAVRTLAPLFVSDELMETAGTMIEIEEDPLDELEDGSAADTLDPDQIDAELENFRSFLADVDPEDFVDVHEAPPALEAPSDEVDGPDGDTPAP